VNDLKPIQVKLKYADFFEILRVTLEQDF